MALDCRLLPLPIDFGPSTTTTTWSVLLSFISGRSRSSVRCSMLGSGVGSGFGLEDTSGFRLSSLSFPPSLSISPF